MPGTVAEPVVGSPKDGEAGTADQVVLPDIGCRLCRWLIGKFLNNVFSLQHFRIGYQKLNALKDGSNCGSGDQIVKDGVAPLANGLPLMETLLYAHVTLASCRCL
jgi:hypothetical protein